MALRNLKPSGDTSSVSMVPLKFSRKVPEMVDPVEPDVKAGFPVETDVDIDLREVYFLIMQFLSVGPFKRTCGQFWNELSEHQLLPRRYHAWYSRNGACSGDEDDDGKSLPLCHQSLVERYPHIEKDHLVRLLKQLFVGSPQVHGMVGGFTPKAADVPTILGSGSFSLLGSVRDKEEKRAHMLPGYLRWPHMQADQVRGLSLREIGGGFTKHHRASSVRAACYVIAKPSTLVQKMQIIKKMRGHQNAVYCAIFDRSGRYVITGSDDRLVKIWSMETAFCLASCRGHEGDITDLAVSSNNTLAASSSNDFIIRVWRLPDGLPISVLRGHTGAVTAIAFSPRPGSYQLLSSSDDGTCRIWDARSSQVRPRIYVPKPPGKSNDPSSNIGQQSHQILCCAYNANGTVFVTGSSDTFARVWNACKTSSEDSEQPNHEMDALSGHENDVNYVQFSGCAVASRSSTADAIKEDNIPKFKNSWFTHDNIVTCSRDGSAIIWIPRSRRSHGKVGRWTRAYHLKVPPPPMPPQPPRGGPRQRFQPIPRGVNMIVWSLDNRFVLAAIMDCRICVWNASDGSLVHCLTGHSESTFVLDVHPFNPRIAMSAGYDGKTIIWDIWEGSPVRIYDVGRFKLVDGKFSPDGTSIILSDEVGQIFIIATGQGESQKDAQYDQFFLGDYRPLIQDANGNVLDQETQLVPYRRNVQDLLCDSSMIPYPDPYQSLYQKRRLGAIGIEWRPPSVKFAVGPTYNTSSGDFQMLPILDLDRWVEPLPELLDAIDWEPENEVQSDDNDSEYNVPEEYSSEGEHGNLSESSSGEPECSAEESGVEYKRKDAPRRSKRKKHKSEVEVTTTSGRRVKRRNLDECEGTSVSRTHSKQRSKNGRLTSKKKSSKSKTLRPQRRAARNALDLFSRIGDSSEEEEDGQFESTSESESEFPDSNTQSIESESMHQSEGNYPRDKAALIDEFEDVAKPSENQANPGRRRLVLKLPLRDSKAAISVENPRSEYRGVESMIDAIPKENSDASNLKGTSSTAFQPILSIGDISDTMMLETVKGMLADPKEARAGIREVHFLPFNPVDKRTALTYIDSEGNWHRASKGAPEQILALCNCKEDVRHKVHSVIDKYAERGLRSLAVARQEVPEKNKDSPGGPWQFVGLLPLFDPPRHDSAETIRRALNLGVNVKMITGDQLAIAKETGRRLGMGTNMYPSSSLLGQDKDASIAALPVDELIEKADGFAGVFPEHKYEIVKKLQEKKHICGMTGDGVNDAPALKKADIGIAVADATDAARSASDIVLTEPGLSVIISAVLTSRAIFQRMKNYTIYAVSITIRIVLGFMLIALIWKFDFSPFMVLIIAILNDGTIMTISKDRVKPSPTPDSWKLKEIFATGVVYGSYLALMTVIFFWAMKDTDFFSDKFGVRSIRHSGDEMMSALYLQVSIVSQALIFVTRSRSWFFVERPGLLLVFAFFVAQLVATLVAVYANWGFARVKGIGWGWAGVIWLYSVVFFFPLDLFKFAIRYILSGKAWDNLLENRTAFTSKKDYGREEREAQWAMAQRTLHGLQPPETGNFFSDKSGYRELSEIAEQAKKRAEVARLRELNTLKGHVESVVKLKGLDIDTIQQHYTV